MATPQRQRPLPICLVLCSWTVQAGCFTSLLETKPRRAPALLQTRLEADDLARKLRPDGDAKENTSRFVNFTNTDSWPKMELLRFVTPYGTDMEALVDLTPYSQMLQSSLSTFRKAIFYVEIDTWVSNDTNRSYLYVNNETGMCTPAKTSDGNGWNVSVDLLIWQKPSKSTFGSSSDLDYAKVQPRATIALASISNFRQFDLGVVSVINGTLQASQKQLTLAEATDFSLVAGPPAVYPCPDGPDSMKRAAQTGFISRQAEAVVAEMLGDGSKAVNESALKERLDDLEQMYVESLTPTLAGTVTAAKTTFEGMMLTVNLSDKAELRQGMPVFYGSDVVTDKKMGSRWFNSSLPWKPFGFVEGVNGTTFIMNVSSQLLCFAKLNVTDMPKVMVLASPDALETVQGKVKAIVRRGADTGLLGQARNDLLFLHVSEGAESAKWILTQDAPIGYLATSEKASNFSNFSDGFLTKEVSATQVCVVKQNRQGFLFTRRFNASLAAGERALLQLVVTGHGWAQTTEQCGEYCHAIYHLKIDGKSFANVTQWRPDCGLNPIGHNQHGTWDEHRNGWCPGSVEPGVFIDATDFLQSPLKHSLTLDVTVWSNLTHEYAPYSDFSGYANSDKAMLAVASNIFIYDEHTVAAARKKSKSFTKAEAALRDGCSDPDALKPPAVPRDLAQMDTSAVSTTPLMRSDPPLPPGRSRYDFEARSPWYFYNESKEGSPGASDDGVLVPVFQGRLMQSNSRHLEIAIEKKAITPKKMSSWQQVALRLRLEKPTGKETDHWDRFGSVGMLLPGDIAGVQVMEETATPETFRTWKVQAPPLR